MVKPVLLKASFQFTDSINFKCINKLTNYKNTFQGHCTLSCIATSTPIRESTSTSRLADSSSFQADPTEISEPGILNQIFRQSSRILSSSRCGSERIFTRIASTESAFIRGDRFSQRHLASGISINMIPTKAETKIIWIKIVKNFRWNFGTLIN